MDDHAAGLGEAPCLVCHAPRRGRRAVADRRSGLCVKTTLVDAQAGLVSVERVGRQPQPVTRLVLIQALAKTGHDEAAIDMATQIGVDEVIPWQANRSIAKWKAVVLIANGGRSSTRRPSSRAACGRRNWRSASQASR